MIEISVFLICDGLWAFPIRIAWPRTHTEATARARDKYDTSKGGGRAHRYISHSLLREGERPQCKFEDTRREQNRILVLTNKDILRALGRRHDGWLACSDTADAPATGPSHHAHTPTPTPTPTRTHTRTHAQARTRARHTNVSSECKDEGTTSIRRPARSPQARARPQGTAPTPAAPRSLSRTCTRCRGNGCAGTSRCTTSRAR